MLSRTKPRLHPRSLDALFPRVAVKRCARGHSQTPEWKRHHGCSTCRKQDEARAIEDKVDAAIERAERARGLPKLPDPYVLTDYHGRVVGRFRAGGRGPQRRGRLRRRP